MSLQVWLPLNGNLTNQGLSPATFSVVNSGGGLASSTSGGKVVSGTYTRTTANTASYIKSDINFSLPGDFSMCCWAKVTGIGSAQTANGIITHHGHITGGGGITMKDVSSTDLRMSINTGTNDSNRTYCTYYGSTNIYNQWHHLCVTYERSTQRYRMYVDGRKETIVGYGDYITFGDTVAARPFCLFAWSTDHLTSPDYRPPCQLNDVRLYDHLLSPKEIHEIAKGMACHYKLDQAANVNKAKNTPLTIYNNYSVSASITKLDETFMGYPIYRLTMIPTSGSVGGFQTELWSHGVYQSSWTYNASTKYCYWIYYRPITHGDVRVGGTASNIGGWTEIPPEPFGQEWYRVGQYRNGGITSAQSDSIFTSFYTPSAAVGVPITIDWCAPHLIEGVDRIVEDYCVDGDGTLKDVSGYGKHLTIAGSPLIVPNSPRYNNACDYRQKGYFYKDNFNMTTDNFTIAFWAKFPSAINNQHFMLGTFNSWTGNGFGLWRDIGGNSYSSLIKSSSQNYSGGPLITFSANSWDHYAYTYNNSVLILYKNGIEQGRTSYSGTVSHPVLYLGNSLYGDRGTENDECSMSDFRFYSTALSAADVKELYNVGASVSNNGQLFTNEINEFNPSLKSHIEKSAQVVANGFSEKAVPLYEMKIKALDDKSMWARIHYLDVTNSAQYFASSAEVEKCIGKHNRYSRIGDITKYKQSDGYEFMLTYPEITRKLPAGYTKLKCIEATGTQYIKTGVTGAGRWEFDIQFTNTSTRQLMGYGGSRDEYWGCQDNGGYGLFNSNTRGRAGNRDTIVHDAQNFLLQVQNQSLTGIATSNVSSKEYQIFAIDGGYNCKAKLYRCQCIKGTVAIRDFIPAQRQSDGAIGLYDVINNGFYTNAGSGSFQYEYDGYQFLEYIRATGTQYINTGFIPNSNTRVIVRANLATGTSVYGITQTNAMLNLTGAGDKSGMYFYWGSGGASTRTNYFDAVHTFEQNKNVCYVDGAHYYTYTATSWSSSYPMFLFGRSASGSLNDAGTCSIYSCQIYDNGTLVRDYIPAVNNRGEIGMYDKLNDKFYTNQGSGSFTGGPMRDSLPLYNRWIQNTWTTDVNQGDNISYQMITTAWPDHSGPIKPANSGDTKYDCDNKATGNWYAPIGQYRAWSGGIPAADSNPRKKTELWVRIDRMPNTFQYKVYDNSFVASSFNEI